MTKNKRLVFLGILLVLSVIPFCQLTNKTSIIRPAPGSCTIFSARVGDIVLFGNNEDYNNPKTFLWTEPANRDDYGAIYLGFENNSYQGGINEKGLCFDANSLPDSKMNPHRELAPPPFYNPPYEKYTVWAPVFILRKAATVEEAIKIAGKFQRNNWSADGGSMGYQIHLADATGDAVVISVDKNGELAFTRKNNTDKYFISTNFNKANPENAFDYPCKRYNTAAGMLGRLGAGRLHSVDYFKSILDSTHVEGSFNNTLYSNIFDLTNKVIYLYYWHQYGEVVVLHVDEEIKKGKTTVSMKDLFSKNTLDKASKEYRLHDLIFYSVLAGGITIMIAIILYFKRRRMHETV